MVTTNAKTDYNLQLVPALPVYRNIFIRFVAVNLYPKQNTITAFQQTNWVTIKAAFVLSCF